MNFNPNGGIGMAGDYLLDVGLLSAKNSQFSPKIKFQYFAIDFFKR